MISEINEDLIPKYITIKGSFLNAEELIKSNLKNNAMGDAYILSEDEKEDGKTHMVIYIDYGTFVHITLTINEEKTLYEVKEIISIDRTEYKNDEYGINTKKDDYNKSLDVCVENKSLLQKIKDLFK